MFISFSTIISTLYIEQIRILTSTIRYAWLSVYLSEVPVRHCPVNRFALSLSQLQFMAVIGICEGRGANYWYHTVKVEWVKMSISDGAPASGQLSLTRTDATVSSALPPILSNPSIVQMYWLTYTSIYVFLLSEFLSHYEINRLPNAIVGGGRGSLHKYKEFTDKCNILLFVHVKHSSVQSVPRPFQKWKFRSSPIQSIAFILVLSGIFQVVARASSRM